MIAAKHQETVLAEAKKAKKYISKEELSTGCRPVDYL